MSEIIYIIIIACISAVVSWLYTRHSHSDKGLADVENLLKRAGDQQREQNDTIKKLERGVDNARNRVKNLEELERADDERIGNMQKLIEKIETDNMAR